MPSELDRFEIRQPVLRPIANSGLRRVEDLLPPDVRKKLRDDLIEMERCRRRALAFAHTYVIGGS